MKETLKNYRKLAIKTFGEKSEAVKFLDKKIAEQGENTVVRKDERQMLYLLNSLDQGKSSDACFHPDTQEVIDNIYNRIGRLGFLCR